MAIPDVDKAVFTPLAKQTLLRKVFISIFPVALSIFVIFVVLKHVDVRTTYERLLSIRPSTLAVVFLASLLSKVFLASQKWRVCLSSAGYKIDFKQSIFIQLGYLPATLTLPSKTGELARITYLKRRLRIPVEASVSALIYDNLLNVIVFIVLLAVSWAYVPRNGNASYYVLLPLPILLLFSSRFRQILSRAAGRLPDVIRKRFQTGLELFNDIDLKSFLYLVVISFVYRLASPVFTTWMLMRDLGTSVPFAAVCALTILIDIAVSFPIGIGGVGAREALYVALFSAYGHPAVLLAAGVAASFFEKIIPALVGLPFVHKLASNYLAPTRNAEMNDAVERKTTE